MLLLSQSHLTLLEACPRRYQYVFFDARSAPSTYEQHAKTQWGSQFHLLMQQKALDLPIQSVSSADTDMTASLDALAKAAPEVFAHLPAVQSPNTFSQSEHRRVLAFNDYLLTVVYDLVVLSTQQTQEDSKGYIYDWKTHQTPPSKDRLKADWQTRLYQYVLCETTELAPEQISMTYWFVRLDPTRQPDKFSMDSSAESLANESLNQHAAVEPSSYRFDYGLAQHDQTRRDLLALTDDLTRMRQSGTFPKVDIAKGLCDRCPFAVRCDRLSEGTSNPQIPASLNAQQLLKAASQLTTDSVAEIPL